MIVRQSEFARMCGVSDMAVSLGGKRGSIEKDADGRINTEGKANKNYLKKHLKKSFDLKNKSDAEFDIFSGLGESEELGKKVFTQEGREAVKACKQLIKYIELQERKLALDSGIIQKQLDPGAVHFLQTIAERIILASELDNQLVHNGMIMTMNEEYRIPYLRAINKARKKQAQAEKGRFLKRAAAGQHS